MTPIDFVRMLIVALNKLANATKKSFTLAYLFQHATVKIGKDSLPLNNAASWQNMPREKFLAIASDQFSRDTVIELLPLKVNVMFLSIVAAKQADRVKVAKAFLPKYSDDQLRQVIKLALAINDVLKYSDMKEAVKTPRTPKATTTAKEY